MTVRATFPFEVETIDPYWIVLSDGTRIATTVWRPVTDEPVPVVCEMIPYRRRDGTVLRDLDMHPWTAGHGIAVARIDIRGSGDSDGVLLDEYLPQEQQDAVEIIAHFAAAPWSNGNIGMAGISWGGFNALQVAALRPPALKAIITLCSTDDRYADDIHYMGGALLTEDVIWSNFMLALNALPPDPQIVGGRWREMWRQRLAVDRSWSENWLEHPERDAYWRQGSVGEDFAAIEAAVLAVGGWDDSYSNAIPRLLAGLSAPSKGIIGPWTHTYPCRGSPGPNIGYLQEALRWWRHWLLGQDTGIMSEPKLRAWIGDSERPAPFYDTHKGSWVAEEEWPSPRIGTHLRFLNSRVLAAAPETGATMSVCSPATAGTDCGRWGGYGGTSPDMPIDQRREDGLALTFDSEPLADDLILLGAPVLAIEASVDRPSATVVARLCDVFPDGTSVLVTSGVLDLRYRQGREAAHACPVDVPIHFEIRLNDVGRRIPRGHRLRLALATAHWHMLWPDPELVTLSLAPGRSRLSLPIRPPHSGDSHIRFEPVETAPPAPVSVLVPATERRIVEDDVGTGLRKIVLTTDYGTVRFDDRAIETSAFARDSFTMLHHAPLSACIESEYGLALVSGEADIASRAVSILRYEGNTLLLQWRLEVREAGVLLHQAAGRRQVVRHRYEEHQTGSPKPDEGR
ncbi:MAG: CocE/NonD family hydrolase [Hyphomicrobiaceae bacterium]